MKDCRPKSKAKECNIDELVTLVSVNKMDKRTFSSSASFCLIWNKKGMVSGKSQDKWTEIFFDVMHCISHFIIPTG